MRGNWQGQVIEAGRRLAPETTVILIDPRNNGTKDEQVYTAWGLEGVAMADILSQDGSAPSGS